MQLVGFDLALRPSGLIRRHISKACRHPSVMWYVVSAFIRVKPNRSVYRGLQGVDHIGSRLVGIGCHLLLTPMNLA